MTEPNPAFLDGETPTIVLAGKAWPIPTLAARQNRLVGPALLKIIPRFAGVSIEEGAAALDKKQMAMIMTRMDEEAFAALDRACYVALTKAHPQLTRGEFDEMSIGTVELLQTFPVLARQCGLFEKAKEGSGAATGEGDAGSSQTGTP